MDIQSSSSWSQLDSICHNSNSLGALILKMRYFIEQHTLIISHAIENLTNSIAQQRELLSCWSHLMKCNEKIFPELLWKQIETCKLFMLTLTASSFRNSWMSFQQQLHQSFMWLSLTQWQISHQRNNAHSMLHNTSTICTFERKNSYNKLLNTESIKRHLVWCDLSIYSHGDEDVLQKCRHRVHASTAIWLCS